MKRRVFVLALALLLVTGAAWAQETGEIFGKVVDTSGAIVPGVTVTLTSPVLITPMTAVSSETGSYRFPRLPVGVYTVKFELQSFKTVVHQGVQIAIGFNAQINATMEVSSVQETVTVTGETPLVDVKDNSKGTRFSQEMLQSIPSARDPWVIIEQTAGVAMDRQNVGGNMSGQQSNFVARGAAFEEQKWNLDGVDITDLSATGGSPGYYDFDAFQEMQISTGGADVSMQSPGVAVNMVTKSGTDKLRGSGRTYVTDQKFQSNNVTDALRKQGASTGNPIQDIQDYGFELGGPIKAGRAWFWGAYARQNVQVGINNFFKSDSACQAIKANPLGSALPDVWNCLNTDQTVLNNYNAKFSMQTVKNNQFSMFFNAGAKVHNARTASDLIPIESTYRQMAVSDTSLGSSWWKTGVPKTYKWNDRHIFSDRFMVEGSYSHVGNNFVLAFHEDDLANVQPAYEISTGAWSRSYYYSPVYVRPTDSIDLIGNYFMPGLLGGDHSFKFGLKWRDDGSYTHNIYAAGAYARFRNGAPAEVQLYRDGLNNYTIKNRNFYVQDTYNRKKLTVNAGFRMDFQTDQSAPESIAANPFYGQATFAGVYQGTTYTGATFNQLPAMNFAGAQALGSTGLWFKNVSPRIGITYDLKGDAKNVLRFNYARYVGQAGNNEVSMSSTYTTTSAAYVRYPWVDLNGDKFVQANEIVMTKTPLAYNNTNYNNPTQVTSVGSNDPNITMPKTDEILVGFDKQIGRDLAVSATYIWRKYTNFVWSDTVNWTSANYTPISYTPAASTCPAGANCATITYYNPTSAIPVNWVYTNRPDYWRGYQGVELAVRKRMSSNWTMNSSFSYNNAPVHYDSANAYEDPTNVQNLNGGQYAPQSTTSGIANVYVNAKWIFRVSGVYTLPYHIDLAANFNSRSGYPFIVNVQTPSRPNGAGITNVYLNPLGVDRLPTFKEVDFRLSKSLSLGGIKIVPAMDVFNLFNSNTTLAENATQNAANANTISAILAPRVIRFGFRLTF